MRLRGALNRLLKIPKSALRSGKIAPLKGNAHVFETLGLLLHGTAHCGKLGIRRIGNAARSAYGIIITVRFPASR